MSEGKKRWSYDCKGRVLTIESGITVVPYEQTRGGWYCVIVDPGPKPECRRAYPRGGYNIVLSDADVETAVEVTIFSEVPS